MQHALSRFPRRSYRRAGPFGIISLLVSVACTPDEVSLGEGQGAIGGFDNPACPGGVVGGSVTTTRQEHIDALEGCEEIAGDLWIVAFEGMDLRPLGSLRVVRSNLSVGATPLDDASYEPVPIESLEGLEGLERVSGLSLANVSTPDLSALSSLTTVQRDVSSLWPDGGFVEIRGCNQLRDLTGLENLIAWDRMIIEDDESLESLNGLENPPWEVGGMLLSRLPQLQDIAILSAVDSIDVLVIEATGLENVDGFGVQTIGDLQIRANPKLRDLSGLRFNTIQSLRVSGNVQLEALPSLLHVYGFQVIEISHNPELQSVPRFGSRIFEWHDSQEVPGFELIEIRDNAKLIDLSLPELFFGHHIQVHDNPSLTDLDMSVLQNVDLLSIRDNASLTNVDASGLETVDDLQVVNNPQLSMAAFGQVRSFTADVSGNMDNAAP